MQSWCCIFLYKALSDSSLRETLGNIIYQLDKFADEIEKAEKRRSAIQQIIDAEVAAIRKMQAATDTPNLHVEEKIMPKAYIDLGGSDPKQSC